MARSRRRITWLLFPHTYGTRTRWRNGMHAFRAHLAYCGRARSSIYACAARSHARGHTHSLQDARRGVTQRSNATAQNGAMKAGLPSRADAAALDCTHATRVAPCARTRFFRRLLSCAPRHRPPSAPSLPAAGMTTAAAAIARHHHECLRRFRPRHRCAPPCSRRARIATCLAPLTRPAHAHGPRSCSRTRRRQRWWRGTARGALRGARTACVACALHARASSMCASLKFPF